MGHVAQIWNGQPQAQILDFVFKVRVNADAAVKTDFVNILLAVPRYVFLANEEVFVAQAPKEHV